MNPFAAAFCTRLSVAAFATALPAFCCNSLFPTVFASDTPTACCSFSFFAMCLNISLSVFSAIMFPTAFWYPLFSDAAATPSATFPCTFSFLAKFATDCPIFSWNRSLCTTVPTALYAIRSSIFKSLTSSTTSVELGFSISFDFDDDPNKLHPDFFFGGGGATLLAGGIGGVFLGVPPNFTASTPSSFFIISHFCTLNKYSSLYGCFFISECIANRSVINIIYLLKFKYAPWKSPAFLHWPAIFKYPAPKEKYSFGDLFDDTGGTANFASLSNNCCLSDIFLFFFLSK
mmetsp:Transcript_7330/g.10803  ORF Transcript_7330/g.10803 Transcript_7330/m.10803 type:complete len:288 (-) Transcript_7330:110-973(-)